MKRLFAWIIKTAKKILELQIFRFSVVGIVNTVVGYGVNILVLILLRRFDIKWDYICGNTFGFIVGVYCSYLLNNRFVFQDPSGKRNGLKVLIKTYISYAITGLLLNNLLSYLWIEVLHLSKFIAPIINIFISVPINFLLNKYWAYKIK